MAAAGEQRHGAVADTPADAVATTSHAATDKPVRCWPSLPLHAFRDRQPSTYTWAFLEPRERPGLLLEDRDPSNLIALADSDRQARPVLAALGG
jgi:hypothetical protein